MWMQRIKYSPCRTFLILLDIFKAYELILLTYKLTTEPSWYIQFALFIFYLLADISSLDDL